jgi:hypothetical protein
MDVGNGELRRERSRLTHMDVGNGELRRERSSADLRLIH